MSFYDTRAWRDRARKQALHNAGWCCQQCGISLVGLGKAAHVHHRKQVKRAPGLRLEPLNLRALCRACHTKQHELEKRIVQQSCNLDGSPSDPNHPWFKADPT